MRDIYVGLQVALSMVLLAGSAMMIRTLAVRVHMEAARPQSDGENDLVRR